LGDGSACGSCIIYNANALLALKLTTIVGFKETSAQKRFIASKIVRIIKILNEM
jgi:hypothetical protein